MIAGLHTGHSFAHRFDDPSALVSQDDGERAFWVFSG